MKNGSHYGRKGLFILFIVIIVLLVGYIVYDKVLAPKEISKQQKENPKQGLIVSILEKTEIANKIKLLALGGNQDYITTEEDNSFFSMLYYVDSLFEKAAITEDEKATIALNACTKNNVIIPTENVSNSLVKEYLLEQQQIGGSLTNIWQIRVEDAKQQYTSLFSSEMEVKDHYGKCPQFYYDQANQVYFGIEACGGTSSGGFYLFPSDYQKINKETISVNVTLAFGVTTEESDWEIYKNYEGINDKAFLYEKFPNTFNDHYDYLGAFKITEENKNQFTNYLLEFKENEDGTYYFHSIKLQS